MLRFSFGRDPAKNPDEGFCLGRASTGSVSLRCLLAHKLGRALVAIAPTLRIPLARALVSWFVGLLVCWFVGLLVCEQQVLTMKS